MTPLYPGQFYMNPGPSNNKDYTSFGMRAIQDAEQVLLSLILHKT